MLKSSIKWVEVAIACYTFICIFSISMDLKVNFGQFVVCGQEQPRIHVHTKFEECIASSDTEILRGSQISFPPAPLPLNRLGTKSIGFGGLLRSTRRFLVSSHSDQAFLGSTP